VAERSKDSHRDFGVMKAGEIRDMLPKVVYAAQSVEALYEKLGIEPASIAAVKDNKNARTDLVIGAYAKEYDAILSATKAGTLQRGEAALRINFIQTVRDILVNDAAIAEYRTLTDKLNSKGKLPVTSLSVLGNILTFEAPAKLRIADGVIRDYMIRHNQVQVSAKTEEEKPVSIMEIETIDIEGLQKAVTARQKTGIFDRVWGAVTGSKKTVAEMVMDKNVKDFLGKDDGFSGDIIRKNSNANILNPISSKGFTSAA
jgi:hypothetical protein